MTTYCERLIQLKEAEKHAQDALAYLHRAVAATTAGRELFEKGKWADRLKDNERSQRDVTNKMGHLLGLIREEQLWLRGILDTSEGGPWQYNNPKPAPHDEALDRCLENLEGQGLIEEVADPRDLGLTCKCTTHTKDCLTNRGGI